MAASIRTLKLILKFNILKEQLSKLLTGGVVQLSRCLRESFIPSGPPFGRPARAAGGYGRAFALNVRKLTLACTARTQEVLSTLPLRHKKPPTRGGFSIWRRGRDCSAFALPPRKPHPSLRSGPPVGVLRERCSLVEPPGFSYFLLPITMCTLRMHIVIGGEGVRHFIEACCRTQSQNIPVKPNR